MRVERRVTFVDRILLVVTDEIWPKQVRIVSCYFINLVIQGRFDGAEVLVTGGRCVVTYLSGDG